MPGIAASTSETWLFGAPPNSVEAPENSLAFEVTWACTSMPITTSQSPVAPLISFDFCGAFMLISPSNLTRIGRTEPPETACAAQCVGSHDLAEHAMADNNATESRHVRASILGGMLVVGRGVFHPDRRRARRREEDQGRRRPAAGRLAGDASRQNSVRPRSAAPASQVPSACSTTSNVSLNSRNSMILPSRTRMKLIEPHAAACGRSRAARTRSATAPRRGRPRRSATRARSVSARTAGRSRPARPSPAPCRGAGPRTETRVHGP